MRVVPGLYRLSRLGQGVNAYLWFPHAGDDDGPLLFDCGWPWSGRALAASLAGHGLDAQAIQAVAVTHDDIDHTGRLASLQSLSGATIFAHELETPRLEGDFWRSIPGNGTVLDPVNLAARILYVRSPHRPVRVTSPVQNGAMLPGGWVALHTPGHTPGHTAYFHPRLGVLIAGDALGPRLGGRLRAPKPVYCEDVRSALDSVRMLSELKPGIVCCGHGAPRYGAVRALQALADALPGDAYLKAAGGLE